jgi:hypothetical protein
LTVFLHETIVEGRLAGEEGRHMGDGGKKSRVAAEKFGEETEAAIQHAANAIGALKGEASKEPEEGSETIITTTTTVTTKKD